MAERTFQSGILFALLGALLFFIVQFIFCEVFQGLKEFFLFRIHDLTLDLKAIMVVVRFSLFIVIGFAIGLAFYLFGWDRRRSA